MPTKQRITTSYQDKFDKNTGSYLGSDQGTGPYEFIQSRRVKKGVSDVTHRKVIAFGDGYMGNAGSQRYVARHMFDFPAHQQPPLPAEMLRTIDGALSSLRIRSDYETDFELIPFLTDLDSTLAMFSKKFVQSLSYGSVTWGILPFISDVKNLLESLRQANQRIGSYCRRINHKRPILYNKDPYDILAHASPSQTSVIYQAFGQVLQTGTVTFTSPDMSSPLNKAFRLLDTLGVHPDLKTSWDIIPLSFVVDYFLPIGSLLESIHPRGWLPSSLKFEGYRTISYTFWASSFRKDGADTFLSPPSIMKVYERQYINGFVPPVVPSSEEWLSPSLKEVFNTAYLTTALKRHF